MLVSFDIFGLQIQTFGLFFALSFLAWGAVAQRRFKELGWKPEWAWETVISALAGGLIGARLYWMFDNLSTVSEDPLGSLISGAGLTWYGGLFGGVLAVFIWTVWRKLPKITMFDVAAPCLALGYAIGRIGCQISGDGDYGSSSSLPWAMGYPDGTVPTPAGELVHPTPIYETLFMGFVALALWRLRNSLKPGALFALWVVAASAERLLIELVRRNDAVVLGLTQPQLWSLFLGLGGAVWLLVIARGGGLGRSQTSS